MLIHDDVIFISYACMVGLHRRTLFKKHKSRGMVSKRRWVGCRLCTAVCWCLRTDLTLTLLWPLQVCSWTLEPMQCLMWTRNQNQRGTLQGLSGVLPDSRNTGGWSLCRSVVKCYCNFIEWHLSYHNVCHMNTSVQTYFLINSLKENISEKMSL